ncbi:MAG: zinc ribbon domain-containing protein [Gemmatimonadaceae bacterium]|jgi:putative FmdB family regulatory protein
MPTYEYRCANGHDFEEFFLKMSAAKSELPCPTCGLPGERRMSAGGGLLFKGSGFYITDYGKDGKKAAPTSRSSTGKGEGAAGDGAKGDGARGDGARSEGAKADASKSESGKSDSGKSESSKSDAKPAAAPAAPPAKGGE